MRCEACGAPFELRRRTQIGCSARCRLVGYHRRQAVRGPAAHAGRDTELRRLLEAVLRVLEDRRTS
jgi:hypothetical protein